MRACCSQMLRGQKRTYSHHNFGSDSNTRRLNFSLTQAVVSKRFAIKKSSDSTAPKIWFRRRCAARGSRIWASQAWVRREWKHKSSGLLQIDFLTRGRGACSPCLRCCNRQHTSQHPTKLAWRMLHSLISHTLQNLNKEPKIPNRSGKMWICCHCALCAPG